MKKWEDEDDYIYLLTREELDMLPTDTTVEDVVGSKIKIKDIKVNELSNSLKESKTGIEYTIFGVRDPWNHPQKELFVCFLLKS